MVRETHAAIDIDDDRHIYTTSWNMPAFVFFNVIETVNPRKGNMTTHFDLQHNQGQRVRGDTSNGYYVTEIYNTVKNEICSNK